jgi:RsiW-degrading membrane proteinase PrsW (M82 family)
MPASLLIDEPIAFVPVVLFLAALLYFDSYKLVSFYETALTLAAGAAMCIVGYWLNAAVLSTTAIDFHTYSEYLAPVVEETIKAAVVMWLLASNRIGFMIDAAIMGFAVGTGFALVENVYYVYSFPEANIGVWIVRGFGTAIMHGGATALFGIVSQTLTEDTLRFNPLRYLPGLAAAIGLHILYNHFFDTPLIGALSVLLLLPAALYFVFRKDENKVHSWLLHDYQSHLHILEEIRTGKYHNSEAGRFITSMSRRFSPEHAALIFDYIRVHTELALRADKLDLARASGKPLPVEQADRDKFHKLHELERKIGNTAMLALWPHLNFTRKELWELNEFEHEVRHA